MLTLGTPVYIRYDMLCNLVRSAERGALVPDRYVIVDNGGRIDQWMHDLPRHKTEVIRPGRNVGCAGAWNLILRNSEDDVIISNDDVVLDHDTLQRMVEAAAIPGVCFAWPGKSSLPWSLFLQKKWLTGRIGEYDDTFHPIYFEDNDYHYRMRLQGFDYTEVPGVGYQHAGSATLNSLPAVERSRHDERFRRNQAYYLHKWGGLPGHETRVTPYHLDHAFEERCRRPSDINEHLVTLRDLAANCAHVTEFGVRKGVSTFALLHGQPNRLISYDIQPFELAHHAR